jgi:hypothetical protein
MPADGRRWCKERQCNNQPTKRHGRPWRDKRNWRNEWRGHRQIGGISMRRGNATDTQIRQLRGNGTERGYGAHVGGPKTLKKLHF